MTRYLAAALVAVLVSGCGTAQQSAEQVTPDAYAAAVKTQDSQFEKTIDYQGSRIRLKRDCLFGLANQDRDTCNETDSFLIRGWKDRGTGYLNNQLYVEIYYMGPMRFYQSASFQGGDQGEFTRIDFKLIGCYQTNGKCDYTEDLAWVCPRNSCETTRNPALPFKRPRRTGRKPWSWFLPVTCRDT
jgi:hypothetical protein